MVMIAILTFLLVSFSTPSRAQVFEGPIGAALGGTGRAGLDANEGTLMNPALVSMLPRSELAGYYRDGYADSQQHRQAWGVALSESDPEVLIPGQISYFRKRDTGIEYDPADSEIWHFAIGKMFYKKIAVGISVYHFNERVVDQPLTEQLNGSAGVVYMWSNALGFAYVFENPGHASSNVPAGLRLQQRQSVGAFYSTNYNARLRLDLLQQLENNPDRQIDVRASVESAFAEFFLFRLGARWDELEGQHFLTAGLGFNGPQLKIDYGFEKNLERTGGAVHSVDMRMSF